MTRGSGGALANSLHSPEQRFGLRMDIRHTTTGGTALITLVGRFDELASSGAESSFLGVADEKPPRVVIDLSGVEYISSSGLRVLLMFSRALENQEAELRLCGLSPFVTEVFEVGNFSSVFTIFENSETALADFADR